MKTSLFHVYVTATLLVTNLVLVGVVFRPEVFNFPRNGIFSDFSRTFIAKEAQLLASNFTYEDPLEALLKAPIDLENATAVFNTVQGALKQKDSNIHAIGVSFIPAYIPANTRLYHSRGDGNLPESFEWIAFSGEFSYNFAHSSRKVKGDDSTGGAATDWHVPPDGAPEGNFSPEDADPSAKRPHNRPPNMNSRRTLFTFRTKVPLDKVIYLDGASAAKRDHEMDQQAILANITENYGEWNERDSADIICKWGESFGLQGFVRLEVGFEMVLCDFHRDVELVSNITLPYYNDVIDFPPDDPKYLPRRPWVKREDNPRLPRGNDHDGHGGPPDFQVPVNYSSYSFNRSLLLNHLDRMAGFDWARSGNVVDNGEPRVLLDLSNMVTPLNKTYIDPDSARRNISYISQEHKDGIKHDLEDLYRTPTDPFYKTNWQTITSTIIDKFGFMLVNMNKTLHQDLSPKELSDNLQLLTFNLMRRYTHAEVEDKKEQRELAFQEFVQDYVYHTFPLQGTDYLIYSAIARVQKEIGHLLFDAFELSKNMSKHLYFPDGDKDFDYDITGLRERLAAILKLFDWSMFYQCSQKCASDEICFTPTWGPGPFGWGPKDNELFEYYDGAYRIKPDFRCISFRDLLGSNPPLNP